MKHVKSFLLNVLPVVPYIAIILVVILIRNYVAVPVTVHGTSMMPNLTNGQVLILKRYDKSIKRFDVVVLNYDNDRLVKRVIGLPGEHIEYKNSKLYVNGEIVEETMIDQKTEDFRLENIGYYTIPKDYYFVVGDNRINSKDSRIIGLVSKKDILGTISFSVFPFNKMGFIK